MGGPQQLNHSRSGGGRLRVAVMWRGNASAPDRPAPHEAKLQPIVHALQAKGFDVDPVVYFDAQASAIQQRLLACDGVLVWINPIANGRDRSVVDAMLRDVAAKGVWVSAHPDVILKMGTKEVLYWTRGLSWGSETDLYATRDAFAERFHDALAAGPRVLKPRRGNDGQGVIKVEAAERPGWVRIQFAADDRVETLPSTGLAALLHPNFENGESVICQAFNPNANAGMVRCYMSLDQVVGFAEQRPRIGGVDSETPAFGMASGKSMHSAYAANFSSLRGRMENEWVPQMRAILGLAVDELPALWDADFLLRPLPDPSGNPYVLCEINVSCVSPFPSDAPAIVAAAAARCIRARIGTI